METFLFWIFALVAVGCGVTVVVHRNPMHSAIALVGTMLCLAGLYALLHGAFVAVMQVLVYAGAVMVLMLFVVMMLNMRPETLRFEGNPLTWVIAAFVGLTVVAILPTFPQAPAGVPKPDFGSIEAVGRQLFTVYMLPFELTSVLLLIAIIGAVILTKRRTL